MLTMNQSAGKTDATLMVPLIPQTVSLHHNVFNSKLVMLAEDDMKIVKADSQRMYEIPLASVVKFLIPMQFLTTHKTSS